MNTNGYLNTAIINDTYDQGASNPSGDFQNGVEFLDATNPIKLEITYTPAATGYSHGVNGVGSSSIVSVNTVATASISNVIGVS